MTNFVTSSIIGLEVAAQVKQASTIKSLSENSKKGENMGITEIFQQFCI